MDITRRGGVEMQRSELHNSESFNTFMDSLTALCQDQHAQSSHFSRTLEQLIQRGRDMAQNERRQVRHLERELEECKEALEAKERELELNMKRMAFYGDKRTKEDQRDVEDTLSLNRQSQVELDYRNFLSDERLDASFVFQKKFKEKTDVQARRFACMVFEGVKDEILNKCSGKQPWAELLKDLDDYIKDCIKLIWRMVTQLPPMRIEYRTFTFNKDYHKIEEPKGELRAERCVGKEVRYLWPCLLDGGGRIVSRGHVVFKEKQ